MMTTPAIIRGTFSDLKLIKSRSTAQLVIEIPIEEADNALTALGGVPLPGKECWVAIARLTTQAVIAAPQKERRALEDVPLPQRAGMLVNDPKFVQWLDEMGMDEYMTPDEWLKSNCDIQSKTQLATNGAAAEMFLKIEGDFRHWKTLPPLSAYGDRP